MTQSLEPERIAHPDDQPTEQGRQILRAENAIAAKYWGGIQMRIVLTFLVCGAAWIAVLVLGMQGTIPLWAGLVMNTMLAATFYMPMHEAVHRNIWGKNMKLRKIEDLIGMTCSIPLLMSFGVHRPSHMRHHAFTNDPERDPDSFSAGGWKELPIKFFTVTTLFTLLPMFAFIPATRKILPAAAQRTASSGPANKKEGILQLRFWILIHVALLVAFLNGGGLPALMLWYIPARLQFGWLIFIFAWYPHHPANKVGRYVDTRVAVFPGSRFLIRGHDHHALHHLFPRVPHYRLRTLWGEMSADMVSKGVRAEGKALNATRPVVW